MQTDPRKLSARRSECSGYAEPAPAQAQVVGFPYQATPALKGGIEQLTPQFRIVFFR